MPGQLCPAKTPFTGPGRNPGVPVFRDAERETPVAPELDSAKDMETATPPDEADNSQLPQMPDSSVSAATEPADTPEVPVAEIAAAVRELASSAERHPEGAQRREGVIASRRSELELPRGGKGR